MKSIIIAINKFFSNPKCVFSLGLLVVFVATFLETIRGRNTNWMDYYDSTMYFWSGLSPYTNEYVESRHIYFLYMPTFNVVFAPIYFLHHYIGPFVWNMGNYALTFLAVWTLPEYFRKYRLQIFLGMILLLEQGLFSCQFNIVQCYVALFSFSLLERGKYFWAIFLLTFALCTKVYGGIELGLLLCYPKFWRNVGLTLCCIAFWLLLPAVSLGFDGLMNTYQEWMTMINQHHSDTDFPGILFAYGLKPLLLPNYRLVQGAVLALLSVLFFLMHKRWNRIEFRTSVFATMMGFVILFSDCPETHTYVISMPGYMMCYFCIWKNHTLWDKILFWGLVIFMGLMPCDVFCPTPVHKLINDHFFVDIYIYFFIWLTIIYRTITYDYEKDTIYTPVAVTA